MLKSYVFFQACNPKVGNCSNPQSSLPEKNHLKKPHKKLIEKYFMNPCTCFLQYYNIRW